MPRTLNEAELITLLYDYNHTWMSSAKDALAKQLVDEVGTGEVRIGDRVVVIAEPVKIDGGFRYSIKDKVE